MAQGVKEPAAAVREAFALSEADLRAYSPLALAYVGDTVYESVIRTVIFFEGRCPVNKMNQKGRGLSNAGTQARIAREILPLLTGEETDVYRRGTNAKPGSFPKNQSREDYMSATGLESLIGWLYLSGKSDRLLELLQEGVSRVHA